MKYKKIGYWVLTIIFAGMMTFSASLYLSHGPVIVQGFHSLGYPEYILNLLGTAKLVGVISLLQTRFTLLKEWAYAGFSINLVGASWSHLAVGQPIVLPLILFIVLAGSYYFWKQLNKTAAKTESQKIAGFAM
jgi:DoxX-like family